MIYLLGYLLGYVWHKLLYAVNAAPLMHRVRIPVADCSCALSLFSPHICSQAFVQVIIGIVLSYYASLQMC